MKKLLSVSLLSLLILPFFVFAEGAGIVEEEPQVEVEVQVTELPESGESIVEIDEKVAEVGMMMRGQEMGKRFHMKKGYGKYHNAPWYFFFLCKVFMTLGSLLYFFLVAIVVRKGWEVGGCKRKKQ